MSLTLIFLSSSTTNNFQIIREAGYKLITIVKEGRREGEAGKGRESNTQVSGRDQWAWARVVDCALP